jgi:tRNA nucleotidyltransferase (CCA-adding enzyme)
MARHDPAAALAWLDAYPPLPGGARAALVGGVVRDAFLGLRPRELDVVVEGDAAAYAGALEPYGARVEVHSPFGTATATTADWRIDVAMARRERYPAPGALPVVEPATIEEDLGRRDFTVNAIAVTIGGAELIAAPWALDDLDARRLRVLHDRSFIDDPTRLLRMARYAQRLGFAIEPRTAELAAAASFATLSGGRLGAELRLALAEPDPVGVLERVADRLPIDVDRELVEAALGLAPPDADRPLVVLGAVARDDPSRGAGEGWLDTLELSSREREIVLACMRATVPAERTPSALWRAWHRLPVEAVAVAGARGDRDAARRWIEQLRAVRLSIGGDDLIAAGVAEGPEIGRRLERTLLRRLDGELAPGREAELADALAGAA